MKHDYITETELWNYISEHPDKETSEKVEAWMYSSDFDEDLEKKIISIIWNIIV